MTFEFIPTESGLRIHDQIENARLDIDTDQVVSPTLADETTFSVPLDDAVTILASELRFQRELDVRVYRQDGSSETLTFGNTRTFPAGSYELDIENTAFKCYLLCDTTGMTIELSASALQISFDQRTAVTIGVRSLHERPAGVVTIRNEPDAFARAISTFGSALKTTSPERSWPTLRGHPPELVFGAHESIPPDIESPETGVVIEVPPDMASIATVTPLAYYLAARVEVGDRAAIHTAGVTHELDDGPLATAVSEVLHHCFVLDCIVRTEGFYSHPLRERRHLESQYDIDCSWLYNLPLAERTAAYLDISREPLRGMLPWPQVTHLEPIPESLTLLPYVSYALSVIQCPPSGTPVQAAGRETASAEATAVRSFADTTLQSQELIRPDSTDARHTAWIGNEIPIAGSAPRRSAFLPHRSTTVDGDHIHVNLVCNDPDMQDELVASYGSAELDHVSVTTHVDLDVDEFRTLISSPQHFLHYVGHVDASGVRCADGTLDIRSVDDSGVEAFLLNGCTSAKQGFALLNLGSVFGIVTTAAVENDTATTNGRTLARLLDRGYTAADALTVLSFANNAIDYSILGDANHQLCPSEDSSCFAVFDSSDIQDGTVKARYVALPNTPYTFGGAVNSRIAPSTSFLQGEHEVIITRETVRELVETTNQPFFLDGDCYWFSDFEPGECWELLESRRAERTADDA